MSFWTAVVVIVAIWGLVQVIQSRQARLGHRQDAEPDEDEPRPAARRERELTSEITRLRERLEVLERIATDTNSSEARERKRLEAEIDSLRERD